MLTSLFVQVVLKWKYLLQTPISRSGQHLLWVQLKGMLFVCNSTISLSIAAWLEGQSCMTAGVREDTSIWKGFLIKLKISSCSFTSLNVDSNSPLSSSKTSKKILFVWRASAGMGQFLEHCHVTTILPHHAPSMNCWNCLWLSAPDTVN